jgi:hypothetical protein
LWLPKEAIPESFVTKYDAEHPFSPNTEEEKNKNKKMKTIHS